MRESYKLDVRKPIEFISALLDNFTGAEISFEGDLSSCSFDKITGTRTEPVKPFIRNTIFPKQDFVIIPITPESGETIRREILPQLGLRHNVLHILIGQNGQLMFWSYDCFDRDCVGIVGSFPEDKLKQLRDDGILREYK